MANTHRHTHSSTGNLEFPVHLNSMFLDCGGNWSTRRKPTRTLGEHSNSTQKRPPAPCPPPLLPTIRPCQKSHRSPKHLIQPVPEVRFTHTKQVPTVFLERGVGQSILGPPPIGTSARHLTMNFVPGRYPYPCGSHISRESSVQSLDRKRENMLNIAGKSDVKMRKSNTDLDTGKGEVTNGQIHSSVLEQGEPALTNQRGRPNELGEESANGNQLQQPPKANSAEISDHEEEESGTAQFEDESMYQNRAAEVQGVGTSLKVTIQRSSESRAFSTKPDEMTAGAGHDGEREKSKHTVKFTCYICKVTCPDQQGFQAHMISLDHQQRMIEIQNASNACLATLSPQAQEPLQGTNRGRRMGHQRWCPTCQCHFSGDLIEHRQTKKHKLAKVSSRPFCTLCERYFRTPRKFVEHMKSPEHKQRVEELKDEGDPEVMEELITVDAIGCFEGEDDYEEDRNEDDVPVFEKHPAHREILEEVTDYKVYDPNTQYGTSFVVPVAGFLCKICHKFYHFESSARETHCRSLMHFQNLQKYNTLKTQKKPPHEESESDASCSSIMGNPRDLEVIANCSNETEISVSSQSDLNKSHSRPSRKRSNSRKLKPFKRHPKSKTLCSKTAAASQNPTVIMQHLICTPDFGSMSSKESLHRKSKRPDSGVQLQCSEFESSEKLKSPCDTNCCLEKQENGSTTPTHSLCYASQLNSEKNVTQPMKFPQTISKDQTKKYP
ncbi:cdkn1a interacting zinc finger protein 1b isoform X2 [Myxocyprinus asiaticus]|uniref:cdkn1a interacting zinc finger protein 1b isoform X2 n=1 Tax=Myxocyprinus asiaticus TaxID=70543 RepID=UPI0022231CCF|nr:cdkn1a interacting zinc finger protein 1b isoform X2 [Myxocyprinus asiaticus]